MAWVESRSPSFAARHSVADTRAVARVLGELEALQSRLLARFPHAVVPDLSFVFHDRPASLAAACPAVVGLWRTSPASRPFITGWVGEHEIHLLSPLALRARARGDAAVAGVLAHAAPTLYTRRVMLAANPDLRRYRGPARIAANLRWAWLLEGGSRFFSGESAVAQGVVVRRLRTGGQPAFPPTLADAPLLAGTIFDLLAREEGEPAAVELVQRLDPDGARGALTRAFGGRPLVHSEGAWRSYLSRLAAMA